MIRRNQQCKKEFHKGQTLIEYSVVLGVVVMVILGINPLIKTSTQRMIRLVWDNIGNQENAEQIFNDDSRALLINSSTRTNIFNDKTTNSAFGFTQYGYNDTIDTRSNSVTDLGIRYF